MAEFIRFRYQNQNVMVNVRNIAQLQFNDNADSPTVRMLVDVALSEDRKTRVYTISGAEAVSVISQIEKLSS